MTTYAEQNDSRQRLEDDEDGDVHKDLYKDGPLKQDGTWFPRGGAELYFHSHLSEPDEGLESDGLSAPISRGLLEAARTIIESRREEQTRADAPDTERPDSFARRIENVIALFETLPRTELDNRTDRIEIRDDGGVVRHLAAGGEVVILTDGTAAAR